MRRNLQWWIYPPTTAPFCVRLTRWMIVRKRSIYGRNMCGLCCCLICLSVRFCLWFGYGFAAVSNAWLIESMKEFKEEEMATFFNVYVFLSLSIKGFLTLRTWNRFLYVIGIFGLLFHKFFLCLFFFIFSLLFSLWKLQSKDLLFSGSWFDHAVSHTLLWEFEFAFVQRLQNMMFNICFTYCALL